MAGLGGTGAHQGFHEAQHLQQREEAVVANKVSPELHGAGVIPSTVRRKERPNFGVWSIGRRDWEWGTGLRLRLRLRFLPPGCPYFPPSALGDQNLLSTPGQGYPGKRIKIRNTWLNKKAFNGRCPNDVSPIPPAAAGTSCCPSPSYIVQIPC